MRLSFKSAATKEAERTVAEAEAVKEKLATEERAFESLFPQRALFGERCRTRAFKSSADGDQNSFWLEAVEVPKTGMWRITEVQQGDEALVSATPYQEGPVFSFPKTIRILAEFENGAQSSDRNPVDSNKEMLEPEHYETLAKREGIVFDSEGMPHPTRNGMVITKGEFPVKAVEEARDIQENKKIGTFLSTDAFLPVLQETAIGGENQLLFDIAEGQHYLRAVFGALNEIFDNLGRRVGDMGNRSYKFQHFDQFMKDCDTSSYRYIACVGKPLASIQQVVERLGKQEAFNPVTKFFAELYLCIGVVMLKDALDEIKRGTSVHHSTVGILEKFIEHSCADIIKYDGTEMQMKQLKAALFEKDSKEICNHLKTILERYEESMECFIKTARNRRLTTRLQEPPVALPETREDVPCLTP